jgi:transposase
MAVHLNMAQRQTIIVLHEEGYSERQIANRVQCSRGTVHNTIQRYNETGSLNERERGHRAASLSAQAVRALSLLIRRTPNATSSQLANSILQRLNIRVSERTIQRYRRAIGFRPVSQRVVQQLTPRNVRMRLAYAQQHRRDHWTRTIFSDEKIFCIDRGGRVLWLEPGVPRPVHEVVDIHIRIHIWGAVWYNGRSDLVRIEGSMDSPLYAHVLQLGLHPYLGALRRHRLYQDGAPPHWGPAARQWLANNNVNVYNNVPGNSPQLNAIEGVWGWMVNYIQHRGPQNRNQLDNLIDEAWAAIPQATIQAYINHTRTVISSIIDSQGGPIPH